MLKIKEMKILHCLTVVMIVLLVTSCRTTEENYRGAYELAKASGERQDSLVSTLIANEQAPTIVNVGDETMKLRKEYVSLVNEDGVPKNKLKQYNIVVGRFRQIFNARSMASRMSSLGYESYVLVDRTPAYFVAVASTDSIEEALQLYKSVVADNRVVYKSPFPWVLELAQYIRRKPQK